MNNKQLTLAIEDIYLSTPQPLSNECLYARVAHKLGISQDEYISPVGRQQAKRNLFHRKVRWVQQSLKNKKFLKRVSRSSWLLTGKRREQLTAIKSAEHILAASTDLGIVIWCNNTDFAVNMPAEEIELVFTSPPYPLIVPRAYGNPTQETFTDFILKAFEPLVKKLKKGGHVILNIGNDVFVENTYSCERSLYIERLIIALHDKLGLKLMDRHVWQSNKPNGPKWGASIRRAQLQAAWEPIYIFSNDPLNAICNNNRILEPHSEKHLKFVRSGGQKKRQVNADGNRVKNIGAYSKETDGKIPTNCYYISNSGRNGVMTDWFAKKLGLPKHSAKMPHDLAEKIIRFASDDNGLVVDPFAGTLTVAEICQRNNRRFICCEMMLEYIKQGFARMEAYTNAWFNPSLIKP